VSGACAHAPSCGWLRLLSLRKFSSALGAFFLIDLVGGCSLYAASLTFFR
jgi:hypothetical protein